MTSFPLSSCSDPLLYSLKNNNNYGVAFAQHQQAFSTKSSNRNSNNNNKQQLVVEKHQQFSDTSCQERSIMIDKLIDTSADIIDSIWLQPINNNTSGMMSTSQFIREILKRSRATYSMLQLGLFYIFRIKKIIQEHLLQKKNVIGCGRRMFLAALMCASKYLNDKNYRNKTWAKIASLPVHEINKTEAVFLKLVDYRLYVGKPLYDKWVSLLHEHIQKKHFIQQQHHPLYTTSCCSTTTKATTASHYQHHHYIQQQKEAATSASSPRHSTPSLSPNKDVDSPLSDISQTPPPVYTLKRKACFDDTEFNKHIRLE